MNSSDTSRMFVPLCRLTGHGADVTRGKISPDRNTIATGSADKSLLIWNSATGQAIRSFSGHSMEVTDLSFHGSGMGLFTSSIDGELRMFDLRSGSSAPTTMFGAKDDGTEFSCLAAGRSINSALLIGGTTCGQMRVFDIRKGSLSVCTFAHYNSLCSIEISDDDDMLISSSLDGTIRLWSGKRGDCLMTVTDGTSNPSSCVYAGFMSNGEDFVGLFLDSTVRHWNVRDRINCQDKLKGPTMTNSTKTFGRLTSGGIAVPSEDGSIHFMDLTTGKPIQPPTKAHADDVLSVDVRGDLLVSTGAGEDSSAVIWLQTENASEAADIKSGDFAISYSLVSPQIEGLV
jgi:WD40 repeat protein